MTTMMTSPRDQALQVQKEAAAAFERIRKDTSLSLLGKQQRMAGPLLDAKAKIAKLADAARMAKEQRINYLERSTFGVASKNPIDVMSHRDAVSRASEISDPRTAEFRMRRALTDGDDVMARAIASSARDYGWSGALNAYVQANPAAADAINEIARLSTPDPNDILHDAFTFNVPTPPELDRVGDYKLEELAGRTGQ